MGNTLCLFAPETPTRRCYRAVLEVTALNFHLKAEEEQATIIEGYRTLLKSLTFPVQILVRNQRLDLQAYLQRLEAHVPETEVSGTSWGDLVAGLRQFLQTLGAQRTLLERRFYLVIPGEEIHSLSTLLSGKRRRRERQVALARVLQNLDIRCESLTTQLASLGPHCKRLEGDQLTRFYQQCLQPERAQLHPLSSSALASVGRLHTVLGKPQTSLPPAEEQPADIPDRLQDPVAGPHAPETPGDLPALPTPDLLPLADLLAPSSVEVFHDALRIETEWVRGIAITAFPREVFDGWLAPLVLHDDVAEIIFYLHPRDLAGMIRQLKRRRSGYVSLRQFQLRQGRLSEPETDIAQADVTTLLRLLASGEERVLDLGFYILLRAASRQELEERTERMMALLSTLLLDTGAHIAFFEQAQAFRSCLPEARDELARTLTLDTASAAAGFPFISNALAMPGGTFLGLTNTGEPVLLNPWSEELENPHAFVGGVTGAGKSYLGKLWIERDILLHGPGGIRCSVIDAEGEYLSHARALGGEIVRIAPGSEQHLNPFDLLPTDSDLEAYLQESLATDPLAEKMQDLFALLDILLAEGSKGETLSKQEKGLLDQALYETYRRKGITEDPWSHQNEPPLLGDLYEVLKSQVCGPDDTGLASRLSRYVFGSLAGLFSGQTNVRLDTHLLIWDVRDMRAELRPIGLFLIADSTWTQAMSRNSLPRALYIDEAASILEYAEGGLFLANFSRRARKRYVRLVTMTQSPELFVKDRQGSVVASNAAIKILKAQDRTSVAAVSQCFGLTRGEQQRLLTLRKQEAMLFAGDRRVILTIQASPHEHALMTTNPVELAHRSFVPDENNHSQGPISPASETTSRMRRARPRGRGARKGGSN
jgi:hypothetical protein